MTNKPMLSVERELLDRLRVPAKDVWIEWSGDAGKDLADALDELGVLLDKPVCPNCAGLDDVTRLNGVKS